MKFRLGFVSNSSSSSFVCEVCGDSFESYDQGISDFHLVMCIDHDHLFCEAHRINPNIEADGNETYTMYKQEDDDDRINSKHCPICQLQMITQGMLLDYALHKLNSNHNKLEAELNEWFSTCDELYDEINGTGNDYMIELTAHTKIKAGNKDCACKKARKQVVENPVMLDVTHCEES